jgi:hypothetical protein
MDIKNAKLNIKCNCGTEFTTIIEPWTDIVKCPFCEEEEVVNVSVLITSATGKQTVIELN